MLETATANLSVIVNRLSENDETTDLEYFEAMKPAIMLAQRRWATLNPTSQSSTMAPDYQIFRQDDLTLSDSDMRQWNDFIVLWYAFCYTEDLSM